MSDLYRGHDHLARIIALPATLRGIGSTSHALAAAGIGAAILIVLGAAYAGLLQLSLPGGTIKVLTALTLPAAIIGFCLLGYGGWNWVNRGEIQLSATDVACEWSGLFGPSIWTEPVTNYAGVRMWRQVRGSKNNRHTVHIVTLWHERSEFRITLWESRDESQTRQVAENYARAFGIAMLEGAEKSLVRREVDQLDQSLLDQARSGELSPPADLDEPPPSIEIVHEPGKIALVVMPIRLGWLEILLCIAFIVLMFALQFVFLSVGVFGVLAVLGSVGLIGLLAGQKSLRLSITFFEEELTIVWKFGGMLFDQRRFRYDELEGLIHETESGREGLRFVSDRESYVVHLGLNESRLAWIRAFAVATIAKLGAMQAKQSA